jgi:tRNA G18 (ribose-2'-O)-methylase SpoU
MKKGFFGIGIENIKTEQNLGTLFRSAYIFNADFIFTINKRFRKQCTDTPKSFKHIPVYHYKDINDFYNHMPFDCRLIGVELDEKAKILQKFIHPERCIYLLGSEDNGLSKNALSKCHTLVKLPGNISLNVSVAGSIVMYDRISRGTISNNKLIRVS